MYGKILMLVFYFGILCQGIGQNKSIVGSKTYAVEYKAFYKTEIGQTYSKFKLRGGGFSLLATRYISQTKKTSLQAGAYEMIALSSGKGFVSGGTGITISNKIGAYLGSNLYFMKERSYFNFGTYVGWERLVRKGKIDNPKIAANQSYRRVLNQLALDVELKIGTKLNDRIFLLASTIFDIGKLVNFDSVLEYPNVSASIGINILIFK